MDNELTIMMSIIIMVFLGIIVGAIKFEQLGCAAKANSLGYKYEWGLLQGCVLEKPNGDKILLEKLRYNELD